MRRLSLNGPTSKFAAAQSVMVRSSAASNDSPGPDGSGKPRALTWPAVAPLGASRRRRGTLRAPASLAGRIPRILGRNRHGRVHRQLGWFRPPLGQPPRWAGGDHRPVTPRRSLRPFRERITQLRTEMFRDSGLDNGAGNPVVDSPAKLNVI
ncbi:hypothetical protein MTO96_011891 [Rhipicephalus appendiculatus]